MEEMNMVLGFFGPRTGPFLAVVGAISLIVWRRKIAELLAGKTPAPTTRREESLIARLIEQNDRNWNLLATAINEQTEVLRENGVKLDRGFGDVHRRIDLCPHRLPEPRP